MSNQFLKITEILEDTSGIIEQLKFANGKIKRLHNRDVKLQDKLDQFEQKELSKTLVFLNIPEEDSQSHINLAKRHSSFPTKSTPRIISNKYILTTVESYQRVWESFFQAHTMSVTTRLQVIAARNTLF